MKPLAKTLLIGTALLIAVPTAEAGRLRRLIYSNYDGATVSSLYAPNQNGVQTFPDSPDLVDYIPPETSGASSVVPPFIAESTINAADYYGSFSAGYLTAPETGNYTFWLASDDECLFYLNTDSADPLNTTKTNLICYIPGWSNTREWNKYTTQQSAPIALEKGKTYYLEILHKEGSGGDHVVLGWQTPSGVVEQPMPAWYFQPVRDTRWSEPDVEAVVGLVTVPSSGDTTIYDGNRVVVYANVNLNPPVTYQWLKNGSPVASATDPYYLFRASMADADSQWSVRATSGGNTYTSDPATLTVNGDQIPPFVESAGPVPQNPTKISVVFSEEVQPSTAVNTANYTLSGTTILSASLGQDGRTVTLDVGLLPATRVYTLTINNVTDMATPANVMTAQSYDFILSEGSATFRVYPSFATDLATLRTAAGTNANNATYLNEQYLEQYQITTNSYGWNIVPLRDTYVGQMIGYLTPPETGPYRFYIASDDQSILHLGTNELRTSKREIANYNGSTGRWTIGAQANALSAVVNLEAGKRYFIEVVYRDGTGGDGFTLFWQTPSSGNMPASSSTQAETQPFIVPAMYMSPYFNYGPVSLKTDLPATLTAEASTRPTLTVVADGLLPYTYTWYKNNNAIPGANGASYTLPYLQNGDNGAQYQVVVNNNFSSVTSAVTTLTVSADVTKPTVASAGSLIKQTVEVRFSEPVTAASAGDKANYTLVSSTGTPVVINSATVDPSDAAHVTLQTAAMPETDLMNLEIKNIVDASTAGNVLDTVTKSIRANNFDAVERINNSQAWSVTADGDRLYMTAGGSDIWGTSDQMVYAYKSVTGNFDYRVQAPVALPAINQWVKMGIMARSTSAANARNAFVAFTPPTPAQNTYTPQVRDNTAGNSTSSADAGSPLNLGMQGGGLAQRPTVTYPSWVRLQRIGDTFYYYISNNGTNWTFWTYYESGASSTEGPMPSTLVLGLAMTSHDTARTADGIMASFTAIPNDALRLTMQPTNTTVVEGGTAYFYSAAAGNSPYLYQWLKNGQPIQDATNANLTLSRVTYNDNNAQVTIRVTNPRNETVTSQAAILSVTKDTVAPTVSYYVMPKINLNPNEVKLLFSEPMEANSAVSAANYSITAQPSGTALAITGVTLDLDERTVIIATANQVAGTTYKVVVNNVIDQACCPPNAVAPNSTDYFYYAGSSGKFTQRADGFVIMEAENFQANTPATGAAWEKQSDSAYAPFSGVGYMVVPTVGGTGGSTTAVDGNGQSQGTGSYISYDILFTRAATNYTIWLRGRAHANQPTGNNDSVYVGFDGNIVAIGPNANREQSQMSGWVYSWDWRSDSSGTDPMVITNVAPGLHTFIIYLREDGTIIDKIVLEPGVRSGVGNTAEPTPASSNNGLGQPETWDFEVQPPAAPTIAISNPANGAKFANGSTITIETATTGATPVGMVEFFNGTTLLGTATAAPFSYNWANVPEGVYSLTARVTDVLGYQTTSAAIQIIVDSTKPVAYAVGSLRGTGIGVYFSDTTALDAATATDVANYTVNNGAVTVTQATLEPDSRAVMLALSAPISGSFSVQIKNVADTGFGPNVMDTVTLTSSVVDWFNRDIGTINATNPAAFTDPIRPGYAQAIGTDGFYVRAGGSDIWNTADGMHFVFKELTGDFDVSTRIQSLSRPNEWAKASVMVREDLEGSSRNLMALVAPPPTGNPAGMNLFNAQIRDLKAGATISLATAQRPTPVPYPDAWLRLSRTGQVFTFSWKTNATANWATLMSTNLPAGAEYPAKVYVGLATTSHSNTDSVNNMVTAYYREVMGFAAQPSTESPVLAVEATAAGLVISWTSDDAGFELKSTADLNSNAWQDVNVTPVINGNNYTVTVPITGNAQFFRLSR